MVCVYLAQAVWTAAVFAVLVSVRIGIKAPVNKMAS